MIRYFYLTFKYYNDGGIRELKYTSTDIAKLLYQLNDLWYDDGLVRKNFTFTSSDTKLENHHEFVSVI